MSQLVTSDLFWMAECPSPPFAILIGDRRVEIEEVYRYLPGRRLVGRGVLQGKMVVFKLFAPHPRARREHVTEEHRLRALHDHGVKVPDVIDSWESDSGGALVLERLAGVTAFDLLAQAEGAGRRALIESLLAWVIEAYHKGCVQEDIHLRNFLSTESGWYMLDAGACRVGRVPSRAREHNLSWLVAQFPPADDEWLIARIAEYGISREAFRAQVVKVRNKRIKKLLQKTERDCTDYKRVGLGRLRGSARRRDADNVSRVLLEDSIEHYQLLKNGASARVARDTVSDWVIKQYNVKSPWHWLKRQFGSTRALRSWRAAHLFRLLGISTPEPVAYAEERYGAAKGKAWFISESVRATPLHRWIQEKGLDDRLVDSICGIFLLMHRFGLSHGDMKASNLLVEDGHLWLIDLDAVRWHRHRAAARAALRKDIRRFLANWPHDSCTYRTFWRAFSGNQALADVVGPENKAIHENSSDNPD